MSYLEERIKRAGNAKKAAPVEAAPKARQPVERPATAKPAAQMPAETIARSKSDLSKGKLRQNAE